MGITLFAGPYVGEFGWELFCFQGWVRAKAKSYDRVIVAARPGHEALYQDYASEFVPYTPPSDMMPDRHFLHMGGNPRVLGEELVPDGADWISPQRGDLGTSVVLDGQVFIPLGSGSMEDGYDVVFHARNRKFQTSERNWSFDSWRSLATALDEEFRLAWIGTREEAMAVEGVGDDLRGISLGELVEVISSSRLVAGPSSGPMHLASLCRTPHYVWSGLGRSKPRYETLWNPFHTSVWIYPEITWDPDLEDVIHDIRSLLDG